MSKEMQKPQPDAEVLLKEYELCQDSAQSLESTVWQTSAIIGIGSIGSLILVANHPPDEQPPFLVAAFIGALVSLASFIWWRMARRWWSIQHAKYLRMRHIEEDLNIYQTRYVRYMDDISELSTSGLLEGRQDDLRHFANYQRAGIQEYLRFLPLFIAIAWGLYLSVRLLLIIWQFLSS